MLHKYIYNQIQKKIVGSLDRKTTYCQQKEDAIDPVLHFLSQSPLNFPLFSVRLRI